jgi:hypothetical protein
LGTWLRWGRKNVNRILEGKPLGKLSFGKLRRQENNIQIFEREGVGMKGK